MTIQFLPTDPDELSFEALKYLSSTMDEEIKLSDVLNEARRGEGTIIVIKEDAVMGVFYMQIVQGVMNVLHLACRDVKEIKNQFPEFVKKTMKDEGILDLCLVSRPGLHRVFKDLKFVGAIYTYRGV